MRHLILERELYISIHHLDDKNTCSETPEPSSHYDSEDTEIYKIEEKLLGTITFINKKEKTLPLKKITTTKNNKKPIKQRSVSTYQKKNKKMNFKCPITDCHIHTETRKTIDLHYKKNTCTNTLLYTVCYKI